MVSQLFVARGTHEPRRYGLTLSCARAVPAKLNKMAIAAIVFIASFLASRAKVTLQLSYGWDTHVGEPLRRGPAPWGKHAQRYALAPAATAARSLRLKQEPNSAKSARRLRPAHSS